MDLNKFNDKIQEDLAWRKKEIINLSFFISEITQNNNENLKDIQYRSFILLLYAHLEWFIKNGWSIYLEHISKLNKKFFELKYSFFETYFRRKYKNWKELKTLINHYQERARVYYKASDIQTKSNINTDILKALLDQFGIDFLEFEEKFKNSIQERDVSYLDWTDFERFKDFDNFHLEEYLIEVLDKSLLEKRNWIAHGQKRNIEFWELMIFKELILSLLNSIQASFYDSLEQEKYLISNN